MIAPMPAPTKLPAAVNPMSSPAVGSLVVAHVVFPSHESPLLAIASA
jgi:hypothetical protein